MYDIYDDELKEIPGPSDLRHRVALAQIFGQQIHQGQQQHGRQRQQDADQLVAPRGG